jgi:hypothetical protein
MKAQFKICPEADVVDRLFAMIRQSPDVDFQQMLRATDKFAHAISDLLVVELADDYTTPTAILKGHECFDWLDGHEDRFVIRSSDFMDEWLLKNYPAEVALYEASEDGTDWMFCFTECAGALFDVFEESLRNIREVVRV